MRSIPVDLIQFYLGMVDPNSDVVNLNFSVFPNFGAAMTV